MNLFTKKILGLIRTNASSNSFPKRSSSKKQVFVGSSTEGKPLANKVIEKLKNKGFNTLAWFDFFKNSRPPLQELEHISLMIDGAILVATSDDKAIIRKQKLAQMRDNVLYEYGLFSGILGRSKCGLLVPDERNFRIPSDFLGVSCFEMYSKNNSDKVISQLVGSLGKVIVKPKLEETVKSRGQRLLKLIGWIRNETFRLVSDWDNEIGREIITNRVVAVSGFIKEDIHNLNLSKQYQQVENIILKAIKRFPRNLKDKSSINSKLKYGLEQIVKGVRPNEEALKMLLYHRRYSPRGRYYYEGENICRRHRDDCICERYYEDRLWYKDSYFYDRRDYRDGRYSSCPYVAWAHGVSETVTIFEEMVGVDKTIFLLEDWVNSYVPKLNNAISIFEKRLHEEIFGRL